MSNKSGFLKGLIFKDDDGTNAEPKQVSAKGAKMTPVQGTDTVQNFATTQSVQGVVDNKFVETLTAVIEENNVPGQDYFEFKQAIENMKSLSMPDQQKFQTVFAVLQLQGCTKAVLLSSLEKYIQLIQTEKTNFDNEMQAQYESRVSGKLAEVERAKEEMENLRKRITELNTIMLNSQQEAGAEEMKLRATEANFQASADVIINEMLGDKQKINSYLT